MVKKSVLTRILFRSNNKKPEQEKASHSLEKSTPTENISNDSKNNTSDVQGIDRIFWLSPKQQHLLSLLKCSNPGQPNIYTLRLYLATIQKLKRHQPTTMEKQRAVYHILSNLVVQQELDRFEPAFEPIGRKPRKTRYISILLDTPAESILPFHHPVLEASKRKPFVETFEMIIPSSYLPSSLSSSSVATFPPYNKRRSPSLMMPVNNDPIASSCSDPSFHLSSFYLNLNNSSISISTNDDEDNIPLAILKTRKK